MRFSGKVATVTGSGRGIGRSAVLRTVKEGGKRCAAARTLSDVESVVEEVRRPGGEAIGVSCEVGDTQEVQPLIDRIMEAFGRIDILVNNAREGTPALPAPIRSSSSPRRPWNSTVNGAHPSVWPPLISKCVLAGSDVVRVNHIWNIQIGGTAWILT